MNMLLCATRPKPGPVRFGHGANERTALSAEDENTAAASGIDRQRLQADVFQPRDNGNENGPSTTDQDGELREIRIIMEQPTIPPALLQTQHRRAWPYEDGLELVQFIQANAPNEHARQNTDNPIPEPSNHYTAFPPDHTIHQLMNRQDNPHYWVVPPQQDQPADRQPRQDNFINALGRHWKAFGTLGLLIAALFGGEGYVVGRQTAPCPARSNPTPTTTPTMPPTWSCPPIPAPTSTIITPPSIPPSNGTTGTSGGGLNNTAPNQDQGEADGTGTHDGNSIGDAGAAGNGADQNTSGQIGQNSDNKNSSVSDPSQKTNATGLDSKPQTESQDSALKGGKSNQDAVSGSKVDSNAKQSAKKKTSPKQT